MAPWPRLSDFFDFVVDSSFGSLDNDRARMTRATLLHHDDDYHDQVFCMRWALEGIHQRMGRKTRHLIASCRLACATNPLLHLQSSLAAVPTVIFTALGGSLGGLVWKGIPVRFAF